jgi:alkane 1-monooxygenase
MLDDGPRVELREPDADTPAWPFDALVYVLAGLQLLSIYGIGRMFATQDVFSIDMVMMVVVVGGSSGFSIITAHELIHRRVPWERNLGRLLLCTVLQEHFFTEHLRGHHARVGLAEDPATARFGETYSDFYRRTVPAQFRSAWKLEARRLGDEEMSLFDPRMLKNRILHGIVVGWAMGFALLVAFGFAAFVAFLVQAFMASRLLEAVNYFEHWGLSRKGSRVRPRDSWDTHSWFTYYALVGLSRHADHHYEQTRPYQQLRIFEEAPLLPSGYIGMVDMVMGKNDEYRELATEELRRRELGPFEDPAFAEQFAATQQQEREAAAAAPAPTGLRGWWLGLPPLLRGVGVAVGLALGASLGIQLEAGDGSPAAFLARALLCAWIIGAFVLIGRLRASLEDQGTNAGWAWAVALSALVALGLATDAILGMIG